MSKAFDWIRNIIDNVITVPRMALAVAILFVVMALVVITLNTQVGVMARVRRANKMADKFYKINGSIDYGNIVIFRKKSVKKLPKKVRRAWTSFEASGMTIEKSIFAPLLRERAAKGGSTGFAIYLYIFIAMTLLLVVAMCFSSIASEVASLYICGSLIAGALGLFFVGIHLYCMDKRTDKRLDDYITNIISRMLVFKPRNYVVNAAVADLKMREASPILDNPKTYGAPIAEPTKAEPMVVNYAATTSTPIITNSANSTLTAQQEKTEPIIINSAWKASDFNKLEGLMAREGKLMDGYASMESIDGRSAYDDSVARLDRLVSKLIGSSNATPELIETVYECINAAIETKYAKPIDELRMRCVIRRLRNA